MKTLIVSGGQIDVDFVKKWLKSEIYARKIAVDRGIDFFYCNQIKPDLIVGDFDSVSSEALEYFQKQEEVESITLNPIKDDTDTEFAIRTAIEKGATSITLLGATGTRLDHVLGNMELLGIGLEKGVEMELVDSHNRIRMVSTGTHILEKEKQFGKYVSLIPISKQVAGLTLEGFKYPLSDYTLEKFCTLGISNEIVEEIAKIQLSDGILLVIESSD